MFETVFWSVLGVFCFLVVCGWAVVLTQPKKREEEGTERQVAEFECPCCSEELTLVSDVIDLFESDECNTMHHMKFKCVGCTAMTCLSMDLFVPKED